MVYCRQWRLHTPPCSERSVMATKPIRPASTASAVERFPEFPPRDDMQNPRYLHRPGHIAALALHFGEPETTLVMGEVPVGWRPSQREGIRIPDLLVAFGVDCHGILDEREGYAIEREGKPPDFALEVASRTTGTNGYNEKRRDYERYGITEYWRYDPSGGRYHDAALAGDRLVEGGYRPINIEWSDDTHCRGYSEVLRLFLCWEDGQLRWYDPENGAYLRTFDEEVFGRQSETVRADQAEAEVRRLRQRLEELGDDPR